MAITLALFQWLVADGAGQCGLINNSKADTSDFV
jgi:hypothetical protein